MNNTFKEKQLEKRNNFVELVHAAFILNTSVNIFLSRPLPTKSEIEWLYSTYPSTEVTEGEDQGASYMNVTPKF